MKSKREILEDIHTHIQGIMESDSISIEGTDELERIDSDIVKGIHDEGEKEQLAILSKEVDEG